MDTARLQQQAAEYLEKGQYNDAIAVYQQLINTNPALMSNYWHLGLAFLLQGEELEAQAVWLSVLAQKNTHSEIDLCYSELLKVLEAGAIRYLQSGKMQLVERICWQILELDSDRTEAHYNLGIAIAHRGDFEQAIACWQKAIDLKPDLADAYQNQGLTRQKQSRFAEAIPCYIKALEIQPDWAETHYNLGLCFFQQDQMDLAIACFQRAIQINPDYTQAYGDLGNALLEQGKLDEAIACFQAAIQLNPALVPAYSNWSDVLEKQGKSTEEIISNACILKALQFSGNSADVYFYLGRALAKQKKFDQAIVSYNQALQLQPYWAEIYLDLGKALAQQGDLASAIACYKKLLQIQLESAGEVQPREIPQTKVEKRGYIPSFSRGEQALDAKHWAEVYLHLGKALAQQGNLAEAIASYQKSLEINPDSAEVYLYLGNALGTSGKWDEAIAFYRKHLESQPDSAIVYCNLGIALAQRDNSEEAIACFQKVMEISPDLAELTYNCMSFLCQQGKLDRASGYFQAVLPVDSPEDFYESTLDWAANYNLDPTNYLSIYTQNFIELEPPKTPDNNVHFAFRFGTQVELPATFVCVVSNGRYWLDKSQTQTAIITSDNKLLADVSPDFPVLSPGHPDKHPSKHLVFSLSKLPPIHSIDGTVAVLSGLLNDVYFHWMFDILPRLELLRLSGIEIDSIDYFLINSCQILPFHEETLDTLGIPKTKRIETYKYSHIQAKRLIVPSFPGSIAWMPKWSGDFLRSVFLHQQSITKSEKIELIYISRGNGSSRRIINEDEVIDFLNQFGFKSVTLEAMSVAEQASLLAGAKVVVAPHGSGLTNIVFCSPGTKVIEVFSPNYVYPCYWLVSNIVGLEYYYLLGETPAGCYLHKLLYSSPRLEDIFVNLDLLLKVMKFAEVV